ncbi:TPA: HK97 family phage prohead protease [Neisseria meningitidis]|uniref:HK97 family phage prohead protease n=2 Tax=Neisseria meningitidis TaxID=487 RepID=UPI00032F7BED|nr:HK97 family phage prohead protease [Neisseria meningitidis]EOC14793.1 caudovirus prohead protease family protein [Neisseria meningitidis 73696]MBW3946476.1 caudovirus prohead protease [Neisseria meningitidis]MBW3949877.1 caudovirus prohead protease [Neisseria meningitidis]MBW3952483.1 caudovirus prohead protease [Neisseria meningitidis]MCV6758986.1 HK97 family phage prohead protease [Neisseria meningitidis]
MAKLYAEIAKMEAQDDGTVKVWGYASSEAVDSDGEVIAAEAMKAAIPDYMKFGAVREMHGSNAAGTAIEINVEDDGRTFFGAHIVDPIAVTKVKTGVYKGFSIGGSVTARDDLNKSQITGLKLTEISLVDRPANPDAVFTCFKADKPKADEEADKDEDDKSADKTDETPADDAEKADGDKKDDKEDKEDEAEKSASVNLSESEIAILKAVLAKADKPKDEPVTKSMYQVKSLADVLMSLKWLVDDAVYVDIDEAVIAQIKESAASLAESLKALAASEADKLVDGLAAKADKSDDIAKAESADELAKAQDALKKSNDALAKAQAEIESLKKQAAPPKGSTKAIGKAEDNGEDPLKGFQPIVKNDGSLDDVATLIKAAQTGRL